MITVAAGLDPDNEQAREWARDELSKSAYQPKEPNWLERFGDNLLNWFGDTFSGLGDLSQPLSIVFWILVAALVTAVIVYLARFVRRTPRARSVDSDAAQTVLGAEPASAKQFREQARQALAAGDFDACVVNAMRALTQRAFERRLLDDAPSLTAHEVAARLTRRFPDRADTLRGCADLFDAVLYGDRPADSGQAQAVLDLESQINDSRPGEEIRTADDGFAVPR